MERAADVRLQHCESCGLLRLVEVAPPHVLPPDFDRTLLEFASDDAKARLLAEPPDPEGRFDDSIASEAAVCPGDVHEWDPEADAGWTPVAESSAVYGAPLDGEMDSPCSRLQWCKRCGRLRLLDGHQWKVLSTIEADGILTERCAVCQQTFTFHW